MGLANKASQPAAAATPIGKPGADVVEEPVAITTDRAHTQSPLLKVSDVFGASFWVFGAGALIAGTACFLTLGADAFNASISGDIDLLLLLIPRFAAGMLIAAFVKELLPRERIANYVGDGAGVSAIGIAAVVGAMTPGGPMTSFPLVRALQDAGTGRGPLVAYITSWSTLGFQRVLNWELPLLGPDLTALRAIVSLPLPIIAGLIARMWPTPEAREKKRSEAGNV
ncbi:MAG: permease [Hyphomicrobiaceae bacterium]